MKELTVTYCFAEVGRVGALQTREIEAANRALRDSGIVPRSGRSQGAPQVETVHGAAAILACLGLDGVQQIDLGQFVRTIWHNQGYGPLARYRDYITPVDKLPRCPPHDAATLGRVVEAMIEATIDPAQRSAFDNKFNRLTVFHTWMRADLSFDDRTEIFEARPGTLRRAHGAELTSGQFVTNRFCGLPIFKIVGDIVALNRAEAKRIGVKIETASAYSALGEEPIIPRRTAKHREVAAA